MGDPFDIIIIAGAFVLLVIEAAYAVWCVQATRREYDRRLVSSVVFDRLIYGDTRVGIGAAILVVLFGYGLLGYVFGWPSIRPWGSLIGCFALGLLLWGPIATRRMLKRIERGEPR
jgi:hypothetical protein